MSADYSIIVTRSTKRGMFAYEALYGEERIDTGDGHSSYGVALHAARQTCDRHAADLLLEEKLGVAQLYTPGADGRASR